MVAGLILQLTEVTDYSKGRTETVLPCTVTMELICQPHIGGTNTM